MSFLPDNGLIQSISDGGGSYTKRLGSVNIYGFPFTTLGTKKGTCRTYASFINRKVGSCFVYNNFGILIAHPGIHRGICGVAASAFVGKHVGQVASYQVFTGTSKGLFGVQLSLAGKKLGTNNIYWLFGGADHKGKITIGAGVVVVNTFTGGKVGYNRIANDTIAGYLVYIGVNVLPDLNGPADGFSATLPISVYCPFPGIGGLMYTDGGDIVSYDGGDTVSLIDHDIPIVLSVTKTIYVVVRKRDHYGLISQNQKCTKIVLTPSGKLLPAVAIPSGFRLTLQATTRILVRAIYTAAMIDSSPANFWGIWIAPDAPPDTSLSPTVTVPVLGPLLQSTLGPNTPGTYYVTVALFRSADSAWTDVQTLSIKILVAPPPPPAVASGYQLSADCSTKNPS